MWILAKLRNHKFFNIFDLNEAIFEYLEELNKTPIQKMEGSRHSIYETIEKAVLKPLPKNRYVFAVWKDCTVNIDHHIAFEKNYYSTPYQLVRKKVSVRASSTTVEIFYKGKRVASHLRKYGKANYSTEKQHRPKSHQEYLNWTPSRLIHWAKTIGPNTSELVKKVLEKSEYPEQAYRRCLGIIRLGKIYPKDRMEEAAQRAIKYDTISYSSFVSILKKGLDQIPSPEENETEKPINHENIRGSHYYRQKGGE